MDKTKTIAIVAVVIIIVAACAAVGLSKGKSNSDSSFTIVDGCGTEFKFDGPIDGIVSVNTNIPKAMKILGYEDQLKGISFYSSSSDSTNWEKFSPLFPNSEHMTYAKALTGEEIVDKAKVKYVVAPTASMTVTADQEKEYNNLGVQVIRLDCNGDTFFEDVEKLITLFGGKDATNANYDSFNKMYNDVVNTVLDKAKGTDFSDKTFLTYFNTGKAFYNQTAQVSMNIEQLYGKNALRSISGLDLSGVTNSATADGMKESVIKVDADKPIDKIFIRGSSSTNTTDAALKVWTGSEICTGYDSLSAIAEGEVYVFNSDMVSGPLSFVGFVLYAEIIGIDTGYNAAELVEQYNEAYGFDESLTGLAFQIVDGEASEIVVE